MRKAYTHLLNGYFFLTLFLQSEIVLLEEAVDRAIDDCIKDGVMGK